MLWDTQEMMSLHSRFAGPRLKKCSLILNAAMQSKYLWIDTHYLSRSDMCSITTFEAPYLWTSVNGWAHTCCVDAWTNCVWALPIMDAQWYSTLNVAKQSKYNWTTFNFYTELPHVQLICDWHVTSQCTLHVSTHNVGCVRCTPQWCVHMWASMRSFSWEVHVVLGTTRIIHTVSVTK